MDVDPRAEQIEALGGLGALAVARDPIRPLARRAMDDGPGESGAVSVLESGSRDSTGLDLDLQSLSFPSHLEKSIWRSCFGLCNRTH